MIMVSLGFLTIFRDLFLNASGNFISCVANKKLSQPALAHSVK